MGGVNNRSFGLSCDLEDCRKYEQNIIIILFIFVKVLYGFRGIGKNRETTPYINHILEQVQSIRQQLVFSDIQHFTYTV
jgi:hypothetical protein